MRQDLSLKRDELAQEHQLGELQKGYTIHFGKEFAKFSVLMLYILIVALIFSGIVSFSSVGFSWAGLITFVIVCIGALVLCGAIVGGLLYYYRQLHIYVYTGGLVYLHGNNRRAVRWEQTRRAYRLTVQRRSYIRIDVNDEPAILIRFIDQPEMAELYSTIMREVDSHGRSGQEREPPVPLSDPGQPTFADAQQPTPSPNEQFGFGAPMAEQSPPQAGYTSPQYYQETMHVSHVKVQPPTRWRFWFRLWAILTLSLIAGMLLWFYVSRLTPTSTLNAYCEALKSGAYQTAYNQFSSGLQSQLAEAQFATLYPSLSSLGLGKITNCAVSNVNDTAGSGTVSITFASGNTLVEDATLVNQSGSWKINGYRTRSSPTLTLISFCGALLSQNYPAAYDQLSSSQQSQQSEAQFANLFIRNPVSTCTVSSVDDTAGTGRITRTYADGSSNTFDYSLLVENGTWKINTRQLRP